MANQWFKFYGGEFLGDPKMLCLTACDRSCWLTLLCFASLSGGIVKYITEERLMIQSGIDITSDDWDKTKGILDKFIKMKMVEVIDETITILNWKKRQESNLTGYERVKRYREKQANVINDNAKITSEESRIEENRSTTNDKSSFITTDKQKHTDSEWLKILRSYRKSGYRTVGDKKMVVKKDGSRWLVDKNGTWEIYSSNIK